MAAPAPGKLIFYPVLNEQYATMIRRDWNVWQSGGYVTRFQVRRSFWTAMRSARWAARLFWSTGFPPETSAH
jgi:hypothetical protein